MNIEAKELSKIYGSGESRVVALNKVNLEIASSDFISIMGPSGSGKSTLLHLLSGLDKPTSGSLTCLSELLNEDGMVDSVFTSLKAIPEKYFVAQEDKSRFEVRNHEKVAFLTAISSKHGHLAAEKIEKALSVNQDLIVNVFEADQLVTTRLKEPSSIWDSSSVKIRKDDLLTDENVEEDGEHSIYVAKKPEFITAEGLIKEIGIK